MKLTRRQLTAHVQAVSKNLDRLETEIMILAEANSALTSRVSSAEVLEAAHRRHIHRDVTVTLPAPIQADLDILRERANLAEDRIKELEAWAPLFSKPADYSPMDLEGRLAALIERVSGSEAYENHTRRLVEGHISHGAEGIEELREDTKQRVDGLAHRIVEAELAIKRKLGWPAKDAPEEAHWATLCATRHAFSHYRDARTRADLASGLRRYARATFPEEQWGFTMGSAPPGDRDG